MTSVPSLPPPTELFRENLYYKIQPLYNLAWYEGLDLAAREYLPNHAFVLGYKSQPEMLKKVQEMYPKFKIDSISLCLPGSPVPPEIQQQRQAEYSNWLYLHSSGERDKLLRALIFKRNLPAEVVDEYSYMEYLQEHPDVYEAILEQEDSESEDDDQSSCSSGSSDSSDSEED